MHRNTCARTWSSVWTWTGRIPGPDFTFRNARSTRESDLQAVTASPAPILFSSRLVRMTQIPIQEMAEEWWETLGDAERAAWRERVGERVELEEGEGWFRSETSLARAAFDARWRRQNRPPEEMELPPQLLARAVDRADPDTSAGVFEAGWRSWIAVQPDWMRNAWMSSALTYADKDAAGVIDPGPVSASDLFAGMLTLEEEEQQEAEQFAAAGAAWKRRRNRK